MLAGIGALMQLGLALPTGLAFGYGYGYGVRAGYHSYRPSASQQTKDLHLSANPIQGATGAGLLSAEERTQQQAPSLPIPLNANPESPIKRAHDMVTPNTGYKNVERFKDTRFFRKEGGAVVDQITQERAFSIMRKHGLPPNPRDTRRRYIKGLYPFNTTKSRRV